MCVGVAVYESVSGVVEGMTQSHTGNFLTTSESNVVMATQIFHSRLTA